MSLLDLAALGADLIVIGTALVVGASIKGGRR